MAWTPPNSKHGVRLRFWGNPIARMSHQFRHAIVGEICRLERLLPTQRRAHARSLSQADMVRCRRAHSLPYRSHEWPGVGSGLTNASPVLSFPFWGFRLTSPVASARIHAPLDLREVHGREIRFSCPFIQSDRRMWGGLQLRGRAEHEGRSHAKNSCVGQP